MTRSLNVTPKTTLCSGKSEASVTIIKDSARVIILLTLITDGHKASHGLSAIAELLVTFDHYASFYYREMHLDNADYAVATCLYVRLHVRVFVCLFVCVHFVRLSHAAIMSKWLNI